MTASMSFYADTHTTVRLSKYGTRNAPILALDGEDHTLTVSAFDHVPIADHLTFARELAAACADYVKALETYAAAMSDGDGDQELGEGQ
ncbi:hypothetical protein STRCI_004339 [Streptomyces cinnabarinus]|uniref:Uncharacterized protein n=1 Tax=Streptomyces cinnabarinus TaxID=67287 RepID=A0ABY7KES5_9ACTN|nr:hypothetical protein [Streptomyces cinnabarinus]WAZ23025.1 hypothetical protein STRCI_004339 [Streptomyces cinnabarinus]